MTASIPSTASDVGGGERLRADRPLRIALATESDVIGGAERMLVHLGVALRTRGHDVHFLGPENRDGWLGAQFRSEGIPTHSIPLGRVRLECVTSVRDTLRRIDADVLHSHMFTMGVFGTLATRFSPMPHVITMHGTQRETSARRRRWALAAAFYAAEAVISVSSALKSELRDVLGRAADRMQIIPNGIPVVRGERSAVRRELAVAPDEILVVAVGNLFRNKGHLVLLEALARLPESIPWRVAIAGRPEEAASELAEFIAARGWAERALLLGPRLDIPDVLAAADVYAMPSMNEAMPIALLEAMSSQTAIVASGVGGIPSMVRDEQDALVVPPGDASALAHALTRLANDPPLRRRLAASAYDRIVREFSVETMADAHEALYHRLVDARANPRRRGG